MNIWTLIILKFVLIASGLCFTVEAVAQDSDSLKSETMTKVETDLDILIKRRKAIWEAMGENQHPNPRPLLTLEQFFLHSNNEADLWYNIYPYPENIDQYQFHQDLRARPEVWDVLISITQIDTPPALTVADYDQDGWFEWPNSDHTLIITTADEKTIRSWFPENVQPDQITIRTETQLPWKAPDFIPKGYHQAWLWYD